MQQDGSQKTRAIHFHNSTFTISFLGCFFFFKIKKTKQNKKNYDTTVTLKCDKYSCTNRWYYLSYLVMWKDTAALASRCTRMGGLWLYWKITNKQTKKNTTQTQTCGKRQQNQIKQKGTWISKELIHERTHSWLLPASPCPHTQEHDHETDNHMQTTE